MQQYQIKHIEDDLKEFKGEFNRFVGRHEAQMKNLTDAIAQRDLAISETYVRKDVIGLQLQNIEKSLVQVVDSMKEGGNVLKDVSGFMPMLREISSERSNDRQTLRKKAVDIVSQIIIYAVAVALGISALK